ncbi:DUF6308 family protein [Rhodococcus kronopolitis]|uniref:DUF6308 family protein n=1 Tax=Rhodococcus kronopolitis TaxID=1460226 RepID=A0ABV9FU67_9NOCA
MSDAALPIRLPKVLREGADAGAIDVLQEYFTRPAVKTGYLRPGALWDTWDPSGRRDADCDVFTTDDLVAATLLSVQVPAQAALILLGDKRPELDALLAEVGADRDLADRDEPLTEQSPQWRLETALTQIHGIGRTTASKLIARKRPRLHPVYDDGVGRELGTRTEHLEAVRSALHENDRALHHRLIRLRDEAGIGETVSALRILEVLARMQGKKYIPRTG